MCIHHKVFSFLFVLFLHFTNVGTISAQLAYGKIVAAEYCIADTSQSYAYYTPSYYSANRKLPAIFVFDPAARGPLGVAVFQHVAEKYGYLVFCSNNSRNGAVENMIEATNAMYDDVQRKFNIDPDRQLVSGFSGGSRYALFLAMNASVFSGVIGCGAGYPSQGNIEAQLDFYYCGLVGEADFNYAEMMEFEQILNEKEVDNAFSIFEGAHQWPPVSEIEQAILWIELQQMDKYQIPANNDRIIRYNQLMDSLYQSSSKKGNLIQQHRVAGNWKKGLGALSDVTQANRYLFELTSSKDYKKMLQHNARIQEEEIALKNKYIEEFSIITYPGNDLAKEISWWQTEIGILEKRSKSNDPLESASAKRLIAALAVNCYYASTSMYESERFAKTLHFTEIWLLLEPESLSAYILSAKSYLALDDRNQAMENLNSALALGLSRADLNDTVFDKLNGIKQYQMLKASLNPSVSSQDK